MANKPSGKSSAQAKMAAVREAEARSARNRKMIIGAVAVVGVGALAFGALNMINNSNVGGSGTPQNAQDAGGVPVGAKGGPVKVEVYVDYICPGCKNLELGNPKVPGSGAGAVLAELVKEGKAEVSVHPVSIMDRSSMGTKYSTRAANAAYCVADKQPEKFWPFHAALMHYQPKQNTPGLSDERILEIAKEVGVTADISKCVKDRDFGGYVKKTTEGSDLSGTPTVKINGAKLDAATAASIRASVNQKAEGKDLGKGVTLEEFKPGGAESGKDAEKKDTDKKDDKSATPSATETSKDAEKKDTDKKDDKSATPSATETSKDAEKKDADKKDDKSATPSATETTK